VILRDFSVLVPLAPARFREALLRVDPSRRDEWVNQVLGFGELPDDGDDLPRSCVPYLPSPVDVLLRVIERATVTSEDVFVDVGSGLGRTLMLVHLLTGAGALGLEIQSGLADRAKGVAERLGLERVRTIHGDAEKLVTHMAIGTVFFFYCPFSGERMARVIDAIRPLAAVRPLRLCFVDMPPPEVPWLVQDPAPSSGDPIAICRTQLHAESLRYSGAGARK
jgi:SAM-dependent methyltransferase